MVQYALDVDKKVLEDQVGLFVQVVDGVRVFVEREGFLDDLFLLLELVEDLKRGVVFEAVVSR